ncbi:hypothetical protein [Amycolatopsis sp. NBRC 101858]|uniref:hypothetical protein n=1 Tax=Amycolatopsis sp. NBRC 101858 TaxID=3032200 RepID=UPI0025562D5B|nr:hypothetical protein [Amycolatopsis sp. NBRC 101858]
MARSSSRHRTTRSAWFIFLDRLAFQGEVLDRRPVDLPEYSRPVLVSADVPATANSTRSVIRERSPLSRHRGTRRET